MKRYVFIAICIAIVLSLFFIFDGDKKVMEKIQPKEYSAVNDEAVSDRSIYIRTLPMATTPEIVLLQKDIEILKIKIEHLENKVKQNDTNKGNIEKTAKSVSPIIIPIITFFVSYHKRKIKQGG